MAVSWCGTDCQHMDVVKEGITNKMLQLKPTEKVIKHFHKHLLPVSLHYNIWYVFPVSGPIQYMFNEEKHAFNNCPHCVIEK